MTIYLTKKRTWQTIQGTNHTKRKHSGQLKVTKTDLTDVLKTLVQVIQTKFVRLCRGKSYSLVLRYDVLYGVMFIYSCLKERYTDKPGPIKMSDLSLDHTDSNYYFTATIVVIAILLIALAACVCLMRFRRLLEVCSDSRPAETRNDYAAMESESQMLHPSSVDGKIVERSIINNKTSPPPYTEHMHTHNVTSV